MSKSTLESLPNEIWLIIFSYLSSFDIFQAFLDVKNTRIQHLLTSTNHTLYPSVMRYDQVRQFLDEHNDRTNRFLTAIHTFVLDYSCSCAMLYINLETRLKKLSPSIKKLVILDGDFYATGCIYSIILPLFSTNNTLQHLHITFSDPVARYSRILSLLVEYQISVHTMVLEVKNGHDWYPHEMMELLHDMQPLYWPNTAQLTLSIQHPSELTLLLKRGSLPAIEHLNVINEEMRTVLPVCRLKPISNMQLCQHELLEIADGSRLRSLILRDIKLKDVVILMASLNMPLLEKFIFVDMYDNTLDHVGKFQELCGSTYLPSLKNLHFSFCFPQEIEYAWRMSSFNDNGKWPFDNLGCYLDDSWISVKGSCRNFATETLFVVYRHPINVLLQHKRTMHNHRLVEHITVPIVSNGRRKLKLTCNEVDQPEKLFKTLQMVASRSVERLDLKFEHGQTIMPEISNFPSSSDLLLRHLRSITFHFDPDSVPFPVRTMIVQQILDASPNLSHLEISWEVFCHCLKTYSNLKHLRLILNVIEAKSEKYFNIYRLIELAPHLRFIETTGANVMLTQSLIDFILKLISAFPQLVELGINKDCWYQSKPLLRHMFLESLKTAVRNQLCDFDDIQIGIIIANSFYILL